MAEVVYLLCALTSIACAALLLRAHAATRYRILLLSGWCFVGLAINNILMFIDVIVVPDVDLSLARSGTALAAFLHLLIGLLWEDS